MRRLVIGSLVLGITLSHGQQSSAQNLSLAVFERFLESLRIEAGIPGLSVAVLQNGETVWERGFGRAELESGAPALPSTPYPIGQLSQTVGATLLLRKCLEESTGELSDPVIRWAPQFPDAGATIRDVLAHAMPPLGFHYDLQRFAGLTAVVETCAGLRYRELVVEQIFERLGMADSVPGYTAGALSALDREALGSGRLGHYASVLARMAAPYHVDPRSRSASRSAVPLVAADASTGIVSSVRDLARFDVALDEGVLLSPLLRDLAWTQVASLPTGLGWFVQAYNGEPLVWQFGVVDDAYSSLILKVPNRRQTLIMLANSDGLTAPFALDQGDVTSSLFARLFLRLLVP